MTSDGETISLGRLGGEPNILPDGNIQLEYYHGDRCKSDTTKKWTTSLVFICERKTEVKL